MSLSLKVNRLDLLAKLEAAREVLSLNYVNAVNAYDAEVKKKTKLAIKTIKRKLSNGDVEFHYSGARITSPIKLKTSKPSKPKFEILDAQIRNLKLATIEVLTISDNSDYFKYL